VLIAYWVPAIVAVRWIMWSGEDPSELARLLGTHYLSALRLQPFADHGLVVTALALGGSAAAVWGSIGQWRARSFGGDIWWPAAAMFGLCYLLIALGPLALGLFFDVVCRFTSCWLIL
jgi:hypothetical protein